MVMKLEELEVGGANAPIVYVDLEAQEGLPESAGEHAYRLQHELSDGLTLDALVVDKGSDTLVVSFHGATNRSVTTLPRYERLRTLQAMEVSSMFFFGSHSSPRPEDLADLVHRLRRGLLASCSGALGAERCEVDRGISRRVHRLLRRRICRAASRSALARLSSACDECAD